MSRLGLGLGPGLGLGLTIPLTLTRTVYWDRAGGERNISYQCLGTQRMIHANSPLRPLSKVD